MKPTSILKKSAAVFLQSGALDVGQGKITGIIALTLGGLAVLSVLAFHFPEYLTTPDLRRKYDVNVLREILLVGMVIAGGLALANLVRLRNRWLNGTALVLVGLPSPRVAIAFRSATFRTTPPISASIGSSSTCWAPAWCSS